MFRGFQYMVPVLLLLATAADAQFKTWYRDYDGDLLGNASDTANAIFNPGGYVLNTLDCNDSISNQLDWKDASTDNYPAGNIESPVLAIDHKTGDYYLAYNHKDQDLRVYVIKYDGKSWSSVGPMGITYTFPAVAFALDKAGTPYLVVQSTKALGLMRWNGSYWQYLSDIVTINAPEEVKLAIHNNTPYIAVNDFYGSGKISVYKYDGKYIKPVGDKDFTPSLSSYVDMAFDSYGYPYVSFTSSAHGDKICVMKYNGSSWQYVGSPGFSQGTAGYTHLAVDPAGFPYVFYTDLSVNSKAVVMKYSGGSWNAVGTPGIGSFAFGPATVFKVGGNGLPYIAHSTGNTNITTELLWFNGGKWQSQLLQGNATSAVAMALDKDDMPVVCQAKTNGPVILQPARVAVDPDAAVVSASSLVGPAGQDVVLTVDAASKLNDAQNWQWYKNDCGAEPVAAGSSITVNPQVKTTYYVRGEGGCYNDKAVCGDITIDVFPSAAGNGREKKKEIVVYPNPVKGNVLSVAPGGDTRSILITNMLGKTVLKDKVTTGSDTRIDIHQLPAGIYMLHAIDEHNAVVDVVKFVVQ